MDDQDLVKTEQQKAFLIKFCYWGSVALCVYAVLKYLFPVLFPFVLAFGIAYISGTFGGGFESILKSLGEGFAAFSNTVLSSAARAAASVPGIFMKTVITIIAIIFFTIDFEKVNGFILRQISEKQKVILNEARGYFGGTLLKCIASYGVIFLINFLELWVGLSMIKIPYSTTIIVPCPST